MDKREENLHPPFHLLVHRLTRLTATARFSWNVTQNGDNPTLWFPHERKHNETCPLNNCLGLSCVLSSSATCSTCTWESEQEVVSETRLRTQPGMNMKSIAWSLTSPSSFLSSWSFWQSSRVSFPCLVWKWEEQSDGFQSLVTTASVFVWSPTNI